MLTVHVNLQGKKTLNVKMSPKCSLFHHFLCILFFLLLFPIVITRKTRVYSGLSAADIAEKLTRTTSCWMCEQSKEEKLNYKCRSPSNIGSHNTFLSVSQQEAVISLAPDCMCVPTADTFLMKNSILLGVYACVCKSGGQLCFLAITRHHWAVELISFLCCLQDIRRHLPRPNKSIRCKM